MTVAILFGDRCGRRTIALDAALGVRAGALQTWFRVGELVFVSSSRALPVRVLRESLL